VSDAGIGLIRTAAENARSLRSQLVKILNVPQRVRLRYSLACGLVSEHFEQPICPCYTIRTKKEGPYLGSGFLPEEERSVQPRDGDGHEFDRQQQSAHNGIRCGGR
jgi:hypothetical protein